MFIKKKKKTALVLASCIQIFGAQGNFYCEIHCLLEHDIFENVKQISSYISLSIHHFLHFYADSLILFFPISGLRVPYLDSLKL